MSLDDIARTPFGRPMRRHFLLEEGIAFLNHGSYGATPSLVLDAAETVRRRVESQPCHVMNQGLPGRGGLLRRMQRGAVTASPVSVGALREALARVGAFVGARVEDLAFVDNATTGVNAVLRSQHLEPGDEVLTTNHEYGAVRRTIEHVCAGAGAFPVVAEVPTPVTGPENVLGPVEAAFSDRTRILVIDHVAAHSGLIFPVERLIALAYERGVPVLIDGAHGPGMLPLDVPALGADWYVSSGHKWLMGPKGCGFLWAAPQAQDDLHPAVISHGYGKGLAAEFDWTGTRDFAAWLALPTALDIQEALGPQRIREHNHQLLTKAVALLTEAWDTEASGPPTMFGSMAAVRLPVDAPATLEVAMEIHDKLWEEHRVEVVVMPIGGALWARVSVQIYNELDEYRRLADAICGGVGPLMSNSEVLRGLRDRRHLHGLQWRKR